MVVAEFWPVGGTVSVTIPMCADDVCGHVLSDWVPSLPASVGASFVGWPKFLLQQCPMNGQDFLALRVETGRSERQWKSVLSWMLGVAGARHVLGREGYRWIAPLSAFYPKARQPVDLSAWHSAFPSSILSANRRPGSRSRLMPDYVALRSTSSAAAGGYQWAIAEAKGTRASLTNKKECPASWSKQARNVEIKVKGTLLRVPRHLVIATRVNPNAPSLQARRIQVRAWNRADDPEEPQLGADGAVEIVAANLFGLFKALGLRENAVAIALSVRRRSLSYEQASFDLTERAQTNVFDRGEREFERLPRQTKGADGREAPAANTRSLSIETELGPVEVGIAEPLVVLARDLRKAQSVEEAAVLLRDADAQLDRWQQFRHVGEGLQETTVLPCGVELRLPREPEGG